MHTAPRTQASARQVRALVCCASLFGCACLVLLLWPGTASAQEPADTTAGRPSAPPSYRLVRWREDWSGFRGTPGGDFWDPVKRVPLGKEKWFLSFGGRVRLITDYTPGALDFTDAQVRQDGRRAAQQQYLAHADVHLGEHVRFFGDFLSAFYDSESTSPNGLSENRLDLHQAFADVQTGRFDDPDGQGPEEPLGLRFRFGREELAFGSWRLVGIREGPNVRIAFDGPRLTARAGGWQLDALLKRPIETVPGTFDDAVREGRWLGLAYATGPLPGLRGVSADAYYIAYGSDREIYEQGTGEERRDMVGARLWGDVPLGAGAFDFNVEGVYQWGRFTCSEGCASGGSDEKPIRAWTFASDLGYTFEALPLAPRLSARLNYVTGDDDPADPALGAFNPLYPRGDYFDDNALVGPVNVYNVNPFLALSLPGEVTFTPGASFLWRESLEDGLYGGLGKFRRPSEGSRQRFIGHQVQVIAVWQASRHFALQGIYEHFWTGDFLDDVGAPRDIDHWSLTATYTF